MQVELNVPTSNEKADLTKAIFDALPSMIFVVDGDARIFEYNEAAGRLFAASREYAIKRRTGEILHCVHSLETPEGCGRAPACTDCVVRASIRQAADGARIVRQRVRIQLSLDGAVVSIFALITATPFEFQNRPMILLVIEDLKDISEIEKLIPICCVCRKIRTDEDSWVALETYFKNTWDADFSHGYCPECRSAELEKISVLQKQKSG